MQVRPAGEAALGPILDALAETAGALLEADRASISLLDPEGNARIGGIWGAVAAEWRSLTTPGARGLVGRVIDAADTIVIDRLDEDETLAENHRRLIALEDGRTALGTPLVSAGQTLGALVLVWKSNRAIGPAERRLVETLAQHAATVVENARAGARAHAARADAGPGRPPG